MRLDLCCVSRNICLLRLMSAGRGGGLLYLQFTSGHRRLLNVKMLNVQGKGKLLRSTIVGQMLQSLFIKLNWQ